MIELKEGDDSVQIEEIGAAICQLVLGGAVILTSVLRGDGKRAATHPCTPNFGPETDTSFGLPQHGPMRNDTVRIERKENEVTAIYSVNCGTYPPGLTVIQRFTLSHGVFSLETIHTNTSNTPLPVNFGEHLYWDTPDGWDGTVLNGVNITDAIRTNDVVELKSTNILQLPGKPAVKLTQSGLPLAMCWAYGSQDRGFDSRYACIEPIQGNPKEHYFGSQASLLAPSSTHTVTLAVSLAQR